MARRKLSPREIVDRLQAIDALIADGWPVAEALRSARLLPDEYAEWLSEYGGIVRTLGPLASARSSRKKTARRSPRGRS